MQSKLKRIVIVGATSSIAQSCARLWNRNAAIDLTLVGRDRDRIERVAADLRVRNAESTVRVIETDCIDPEAIRRTLDDLVEQGPVDIALIAHGSLPEQDSCRRDLAAVREALYLNGISPVLFAEAFAERMEAAGAGILAIIGSVAGDRGRKSNYIYGSAKGLVALYAQGLQHRFAGSGVKIVLIKPGPTDTPMTAHLKNQGVRLADVDKVAGQIVKGIARGKTTVYAPPKWALIMMIIRHLPRFVFDRLDI